jgi:Fic family protein
MPLPPAAVWPFPLGMPAFCYFVYSRPLTDGNGRLARALLYGAIASRGILCSPALALAPIFTVNSDEIDESLVETSLRKDWTPYSECICAVLFRSAAFVAACA